MPEGDSLVHAAARLRPALVGSPVERVSGSHRALRANARRMAGATVTDVRTIGKHLVIDFDNGWSLRTHLGMTGSWRLFGRGERWTMSEGKARVVIETAGSVAACFAAPTVQLDRSDRIAIDHLGPDLMAPGVPFGDIVERARAGKAGSAADLLLDQRVMAGVGNVYKSETLFLERLDPHTPAASLSDEAIERLARRAGRLLRVNAAPGLRSTTGSRRPDQALWMYGRAGRPCRRCGTAIEGDRHGSLARATYWCPSCQPPSPSA